ncbi:MAG: regulatory protein RecX [Bacteroidales bacterium]
MTPEQYTEKARKYCAYRERCSREVSDRLQKIGAGEAMRQQIISQLKAEGFVDDQRFARLFARGKFLNNQWGRVKIKAGLLAKDIDEDYIGKALSEIDPQQYSEVLRTLLTKKYHNIREKARANPEERTAAYAIQKGYEPGLVWQSLKEVIQ